MDQYLTETLGYSRRTAGELWAAYALELRQIQHDELCTALTHHFSSHGYHFGELNIELAVRAAEVLREADLDFMSAEDHAPGFASSDFDEEITQKINQAS